MSNGNDESEEEAKGGRRGSRAKGKINYIEKDVKTRQHAERGTKWRRETKGKGRKRKRGDRRQV